MTVTRTGRTIAICLSVAFATAASGLGASSFAGEPDATASIARDSGGLARSLQLGVGKSVIVDLPEDAGEIYVGDPKVANAIVRSAKRIYISAVGNGQTSIFALARDGRRIAIVEVSVGRDVGELTNLLNTAIPGNDIHVRTVANSIILTGSVASAGEAQKAIDIANGFVNDTPASSSSPGTVVTSLTAPVGITLMAPAGTPPIAPKDELSMH